MRPFKKHAIQLSGQADREGPAIVVRGQIAPVEGADQDRVESGIDRSAGRRDFWGIPSRTNFSEGKAAFKCFLNLKATIHEF
jgi:hypothetical protein